MLILPRKLLSFLSSNSGCVALHLFLSTNLGPPSPSRGRKSKQSNLFEERTNIWRAVCSNSGKAYSSFCLASKGLRLLGKKKARPKAVSGQLGKVILKSCQESSSLWRISFLEGFKLLTFSCSELVPRPVFFHFISELSLGPRDNKVCGSDYGCGEYKTL